MKDSHRFDGQYQRFNGLLPDQTTWAHGGEKWKITPKSVRCETHDQPSTGSEVATLMIWGSSGASSFFSVATHLTR